MCDFPVNSSLKADFLCSNDLYLEILAKYYSDQDAISKPWEEFWFETYVLVQKKVDIYKFELKLNKTLSDLYEVKTSQLI